MTNFEELVQAIDSACWSARSYGHDDYGLEETQYHPSAVSVAKVLNDVFCLGFDHEAESFDNEAEGY